MDTVFINGDDSFFSFLCSSLFCKWCMFYLVCSIFLNLVCWVRGNFSGEPGHVYSVCVSPLCGVPGRYKLIWAFLGAGGGTVRIFLSFWLCSGGYGTVEMVKRVVRIFFAFFSLLSVLLAVGCPR